MQCCSLSFAVVLDVVLFVGFLLLLPKMPSWVYPCIFYLQVIYDTELII